MGKSSPPQVRNKPGRQKSKMKYKVHDVERYSNDPFYVHTLINGKRLSMELNTGAEVSITSEETSKEKFPEEELLPADLKLRHTNEPMKVTGTLEVNVQYEDQFKELLLVVTAGNQPSLLGQNWLKHINLNWKKLFAVHTAQLGSLHTLMQLHEQPFEEGLGTVKPYKVTLPVEQGAKPRFIKPQLVPFAIRDAVQKELDRLEQQGILQKGSNTDWAALFVSVPKKNGRFQICGDYKVSINQVLSVE